MAMFKTTWQVDSPHGVCAVTGHKLEEGEEFYTVLFEEGETFRRADYSLGGWQGAPEGAFCFFKTRVPVSRKRKRLLVDDDLLVQFFLRLAREVEPARVQFRFVLALILMRKRKLRYEGTTSVGGVETWDMTLVKDQSRHTVVNPRLSDAEVQSVSAQLSAILHGDMGPWAQELASEEDAPDHPQEGGIADDGH